MTFEKSIRERNKAIQDRIENYSETGGDLDKSMKIDIEKGPKAFPDGYQKTDKRGIRWIKEAGKWKRLGKDKSGAKAKEEPKKKSDLSPTHKDFKPESKEHLESAVRKQYAKSSLAIQRKKVEEAMSKHFPEKKEAKTTPEMDEAIAKLGGIGRFNMAQKLTGRRFPSGASIFSGVDGTKRFKTELASVDIDKLKAALKIKPEKKEAPKPEKKLTAKQKIVKEAMDNISNKLKEAGKVKSIEANGNGGITVMFTGSFKGSDGKKEYSGASYADKYPGMGEDLAKEYGMTYQDKRMDDSKENLNDIVGNQKMYLDKLKSSGLSTSHPMYGALKDGFKKLKSVGQKLNKAIGSEYSLHYSAEVDPKYMTFNLSVGVNKNQLMDKHRAEYRESVFKDGGSDYFAAGKSGQILNEALGKKSFSEGSDAFSTERNNFLHSVISGSFGEGRRSIREI